MLKWLRLHAERRQGWLLFDARCKELSPEGHCQVYSTRPQVCREMRVGGRDCLEAVRRQRTPEQYREIRDPEDPSVEELYRPGPSDTVRQ